MSMQTSLHKYIGGKIPYRKKNVLGISNKWYIWLWFSSFITIIALIWRTLELVLLVRLSQPNIRTHHWAESLPFLRIAKKMTKYYFKSEFVSKQGIVGIQEFINNSCIPALLKNSQIKLPADSRVGLQTGWKTGQYHKISTFALKDHLPLDDYRILMMFCTCNITSHQK